MEQAQAVSGVQRGRLLAIAFAIFIALGMAGGLLNIAWTYMQPTFGVPLEALGLLLVAGTSGSLMAAFGSGAVIGRVGVGWAALGGAMLVVLGLVGIALSPLWAVLLIVTFAAYIGRGTLDAGMNNFVSENYGTAAMNWLHACWGLGLTIAPSVMTWIILSPGSTWRVGYGLMAALMGVIALAIGLHFRQWDALSSEETPQQVSRVRVGMGQSLREPVVLWSVLLFFVYGGVEIGTGQLANTLLVEGRGIGQDTAGLWLSLYWGSFTVGRMLTGVIALRLSNRAILTSSTLLALAGTIVLLAAPLPVMNLVGLIMIGFGLAAIFPVLTAITPARVGREHAANAIGFQVGIGGAGGAVLPGVLGWLAGTFGLMMIPWGLLIIAVVLLVLNEWVMVRYGV